MSVIDFIFDCIIDPVLDFYTHKRFTGKKDYTCFLPIVAGVCALMFFLGIAWDVALISIIGFLGFIPSAIVSVVRGFRRDKENREEVRSLWRERRKKKTDTKAEQ